MVFTNTPKLFPLAPLHWVYSQLFYLLFILLCVLDLLLQYFPLLAPLELVISFKSNVSISSSFLILTTQKLATKCSSLKSNNGFIDLEAEFGAMKKNNLPYFIWLALNYKKLQMQILTIFHFWCFCREASASTGCKGGGRGESKASFIFICLLPLDLLSCKHVFCNASDRLVNICGREWEISWRGMAFCVGSDHHFLGNCSAVLMVSRSSYHVPREGVLSIIFLSFKIQEKLVPYFIQEIRCASISTDIGIKCYE